MARKTKEESQKTRDGILDAAERVFLEKGVGTTAMADLADAAGVSRGAVYGHYKNKIEVCLAMCDRAFGQIEVPDENARVPALDILLRAGMGFLRQCCEPGSVQRVLEILYLKCERSDENEPLLRRRELLEKQGQRFGLRQIRRAVERGELPARLDVELASIYLQSLWDGICGTLAWTERLRDDPWNRAPNACSAPASTACAVLPTCCWRTPEGVNRPPSGACAGPRRRRPPAAGRLPR
ncbi:Toluene efflux pump ttgABC operon repressor [Pseudomonas aeruginosa]|nr:Toluene efflux pump ttgABC operon repressor [Pseudomonas aeruginosa]